MYLDYSRQVASLTPDERAQFYELLAHNLTVCVRSVWTNASLDDAEKVHRMRIYNEILHRTTQKMVSMRSNPEEWPEADFAAMIEGWLAENPQLRADCEAAISRSYEAVRSGRRMPMRRSSGGWANP